jgi:hypothetical protein
VRGGEDGRCTSLLPRRTTLLVHVIIIWLIIAKEFENLGKTDNGG